MSLRMEMLLNDLSGHSKRLSTYFAPESRSGWDHRLNFQKLERKFGQCCEAQVDELLTVVNGWRVRQSETAQPVRPRQLAWRKINVLSHGSADGQPILVFVAGDIRDRHPGVQVVHFRQRAWQTPLFDLVP